MGNHIYSGSVQYFCLQPLHFSSSCFEKLLNNPIHLDDNWVPYASFKESCSRGDCVGFVDAMDTLKHSFAQQDMWIRHLSPSHYNDDMTDVPVPVCFGQNREHSGFFLLCDRANKVFMVISCFSYDQLHEIEEEHLSAISKCYGQVRNYFNLDPQNNNLSVGQWVDIINRWACEEVHQVLPWIRKDDKVHILPNTGYLLVNWQNVKYSTEFDQLKQHILLNNNNEDTSLEAMDDLDQQETSFAFYGWRYTTLFNLLPNGVSYSLSILCMHQMLYYVFHFIYQEMATAAYEDIRHRKNDKLEKHLMLFDTIITSFKSHQYYLLRYESNLNKWQHNVFHHIYKYWNLENDIKSYEEILKIMQETLNRRLSMEDNKEERVQSHVLFILAIIGIFSLVSTLCDFAAWCDSGVPKILGDTISEGTYNLSKRITMPLLIFISVVLTLIAYKTKIYSSFKFLVNKLRVRK